MSGSDKIEWAGRIIAVQPRIRLLRSFDQLHHNYLGYILRVRGTHGNKSGELLIAVGRGAHKKHRFCPGIELSGLSAPVSDLRIETAEYYKTSRIKIEKSADNSSPNTPPFTGIPPDLDIYRSRGHRRLNPKTYQAKCFACIWGCKMPVEIIIDHWNSSNKKFRSETFCYGPKSCFFYKAGATRKVPGRRGMVWEEEDWVDEDSTSHRGPDD